MTAQVSLVRPQLTVCIPTYRDDATALIAALAKLPEAAHCALLVYDDGSADPALTGLHEAALSAYPGPKLLYVAPENRGRSFARNWLVGHAVTDWILMIDADMLPDHPRFLSNYIQKAAEVAGPALIVGGFSMTQVRPAENEALHFSQSKTSECVPAERRKKDPGRFVFSSNLLVHRTVLEQVPFDETFTGWGWEDVDWGLRVSEIYAIIHIENTASHCGLETDAGLIRKYGGSGPNFARLVRRHPEAAQRMPLLVAARRVKGIPLVGVISRFVAARRFLPIELRTAALKLYRAASYAPYIEP
jgi:glycosyltransferase involved in cell wall biosynthesis